MKKKNRKQEITRKIQIFKKIMKKKKQESNEKLYGPSLWQDLHCSSDEQN